MDPANAAALAGSGADAFKLANNHILDFGTQGLADTLAALRGAGLAAAGAGRHLAEAGAPALLETKAACVLFYAVARTEGVPPEWRAALGRRPLCKPLATPPRGREGDGFGGMPQFESPERPAPPQIVDV